MQAEEKEGMRGSREAKGRRTRVVTPASALESIPSVYRPFHSPLPATSLVSVPLMLQIYNGWISITAKVGPLDCERLTNVNMFSSLSN